MKPGSRIAGLIEKYLKGYMDKTEKLKNIKYLSIRLKSSFKKCIRFGIGCITITEL